MGGMGVAIFGDFEFSEEGDEEEDEDDEEGRDRGRGGLKKSPCLTLRSSRD